MTNVYLPEPHESEGVLTIRNLQVAYGKTVILDELVLPPLVSGGVVGVLGPNGAGKSTLLRALARVMPSHGEVCYSGVNLLACSRVMHQKTVGYLPQSLPQQSSLLVYEALESALRTAEHTIGAQEREQRISDVVDNLHIRALVMRALKHLSEGQRQMVGLAQVLIRNTPLLLLDEPTSALDLRWQMLALQAIRQRADQTHAITIIVLHDLNLASRFCDSLILLGPQGLIASGTPKNVIQVETLQKAYRVNARIETTSQEERVVLIDGAFK